MLINAIHHFEILTKSNGKLLSYFINGLRFRLIAVNSTQKSTQHVIKSKNASFVITSLNVDNEQKHETSNRIQDYDTLRYLEKANAGLLDRIVSKHDSVFNIALQVKSIDYILSNCVKFNIEVIKKKSRVSDSNGFVNYAIINSCVDGVVHTLIEKESYEQRLFLPHIKLIEQESRSDDSSSSIITTHFDHLTYATYKNTSNSIINWYRDVFNMKRFYLTNNKKDDFIVKTGSSGMKLQAINYWFCAESGIYIENEESNKSNDFKFIIAEPLGVDTDNQISVFLKENNGPGVQHIGLYTPNIINSVSKSKENSKDAKYYIPPDTYYSDSDKRKECHKSGHNMDDLKRNHVLIDVEGDDNDDDSGSSKQEDASKSRYLLQVFTRPLFDKNTFFLEFIQRVNGAFGFGAGNIKALWNAVHLTLINKK